MEIKRSRPRRHWFIFQVNQTVILDCLEVIEEN